MKVCDAIASLGHALTLYIPAEADPTPWPELARLYGVRNQFRLVQLVSRPWLKRLDFVWQAHRSARLFRADMIYTWLPQTAAVAVRQGWPTVLEMHADVAGRMGPWWLRQFWGGRTRRRLLVTTEALRRALERSAGRDFPQDEVRLAPNGVDLERYRNLGEPQDARRLLDLPGRTLVAFTGHFYEGRGIELLFDLARAMPSLEFLWVGGTPAAVDAWRGRIAQEGVQNVVITGFVDNARLPRYQAAAEILLMPYGRRVSASSGQDIADVINPMKMYEYMATGRAIVTADLPAIREILDETMAVFCSSGDLEAWKSAITALVSDPARREALGRNARLKVQNYTWLGRARRALEGFSEP